MVLVQALTKQLTQAGSVVLFLCGWLALGINKINPEKWMQPKKNRFNSGASKCSTTKGES
jgi:hypothetical protein